MIERFRACLAAAAISAFVPAAVPAATDEIPRLTFAQLVDSIRADSEVTQTIKSYSGKEVAIQGFIIPAGPPDLSFLMLSRVSALGNYCCEMPVGQDETVYVFTAKEVNITYDPLRIFKIVGVFEAGMRTDATYGPSLFRVRNARVRGGLRREDLQGWRSSGGSREALGASTLPNGTPRSCAIISAAATWSASRASTDQQFHENYVCGAPRNCSGYCNSELRKLFDRQSMEPEVGKRKNLVWQIERKLAEDSARPIIFYGRDGTCRQPYVKGLTLMVNSIFNGWRMEDAWLDKQVQYREAGK